MLLKTSPKRGKISTIIHYILSWTDIKNLNVLVDYELMQRLCRVQWVVDWRSFTPQILSMPRSNKVRNLYFHIKGKQRYCNMRLLRDRSPTRRMLQNKKQYNISSRWPTCPYHVPVIQLPPLAKTTVIIDEGPARSMRWPNNDNSLSKWFIKL